jgi:hypothetical protein
LGDKGLNGYLGKLEQFLIPLSGSQILYNEDARESYSKLRDEIGNEEAFYAALIPAAQKYDSRGIPFLSVHTDISQPAEFKKKRYVNNWKQG